jgi:uncharacterized membrane protein YgdD (TMEM256/DUF423 family)
MARWIIGTGALLALLAVGAGAFGAHALRTRLTPELQAIFETGARYHMYHALGLVLLGVAAQTRATPLHAWAAGALLAGVLVFSGSLYLLALTGLRWLGAITPLGGLALMIGWGLFAWATLARGA